MPNTFEVVAKRISTYQECVIEWERQLTAIPALAPENGGDGEQKKAELIEKILLEIGVNEVQKYRVPDSRVSSGHRPNIIARIPGQDSKRTLWLMSHMDVVPIGDEKTWQSNPWTLRVDGNKLFGR